MFTIVKSYSQEGDADTISVIGKLVKTKEMTGDEGEKVFLVTIENTQKEIEIILISKDTKILIGKTEAEIGSIKEGSNITIGYKLDPEGKTAVWVYIDDGKDEDTAEIKEEKEEQPPAAEEEKEEDKSE